MHNQSTIPTIQYGAFSQRLYEQAAAHQSVIKAQLELTYRCNLHCRHCYTDPYNSKDFFPRELTLDEIHRLLDEMQQVGIVWLNLTGGDIFMHPQFFEIYEAAYRKGFLLQLYTNGTLFTKATIERLQQMPPFTIDISCHSVTASLSSRVRTPKRCASVMGTGLTAMVTSARRRRCCWMKGP